MSVSNPIPRENRRQTFVASGGQTVFGPSNFKIFDPLDVAVFVRPPAALRATRLAPGEYTVALTGPAPSVFTTTLAVGRAAGVSVRVDGRRNDERGTDVTQGGVIRAVPLEGELDRNTIIHQELRRDLEDEINRVDLEAMLRSGQDLAGAAAWDARGARLVAAGYPLSGDDVATRSYVDSVLSGAEIVNALESDLTFAGQNTTAITGNLRRDSRAFYVPGGGGWYADWDCKSSEPVIVRQSENQIARGYSGYRDGRFVHHVDEDTADYTDLFQVVSTGIRSVVTGKWSGGVAQKQYKDLVAGDFSVVGRIGWHLRGLSGVTSNVVQLGSGIASNEFAVEQPAWAYEQSTSMAAVQAIVRQRFAPADVFHPARGIFISSEGFRITAGLEMVSIGGLGGLFEVGLDMVGAWVDEYAIRMPQTGGAGLAHAGTLTLFDAGDYTGFDRAADRYFWTIDNAIAMRLGKTIASIGPVAPLADAFLTLPAGTSSKASLVLAPGVGPFSGPNGGISTDGTDFFAMSNGGVMKFVLTNV